MQRQISSLHGVARACKTNVRSWFRWVLYRRRYWTPFLEHCCLSWPGSEPSEYRTPDTCFASRPTPAHCSRPTETIIAVYKVKLKFHLLRHVTIRHDTLSSLCILAQVKVVTCGVALVGQHGKTCSLRRARHSRHLSTIARSGASPQRGLGWTYAPHFFQLFLRLMQI